jgi:hypothetical protein
MPGSFYCQYCQSYAAIENVQRTFGESVLKLDNADGGRALGVYWVVCPNPECRKVTLTATLHPLNYGGGAEWLVKLKQFRLIPESSAKPIPDYVPEAIRQDYTEACLIRELSLNSEAGSPSTPSVLIQREDGNIPIGQVCPA